MTTVRSLTGLSEQFRSVYLFLLRANTANIHLYSVHWAIKWKTITILELRTNRAYMDCQQRERVFMYVCVQALTRAEHNHVIDLTIIQYFGARDLYPIARTKVILFYDLGSAPFLLLLFIFHSLECRMSNWTQSWLPYIGHTVSQQAEIFKLLSEHSNVVRSHTQTQIQWIWIMSSFAILTASKSNL